MSAKILPFTPRDHAGCCCNSKGKGPMVVNVQCAACKAEHKMVVGRGVKEFPCTWCGIGVMVVVDE